MSAAGHRTWRAATAVVLVAAIAAVAGHHVFESTAVRVAQNQQAWKMRHLAEILDPTLHDNDIANDVIFVRDTDRLGGDAERAVYRAFKNGAPVAAVITTVAPRGYAGEIHLLVGVHADGRLAGVRITQHRETPGLGDRVDLDKSDWLQSFPGRSIGRPALDGWQVHRDGGEFDQFTGATVTPRAVVMAVRDALLYFADHREELFMDSSTGSES